ncbi:MAG: hypothetical protein R6U35_05635, partial [Candidatus Humimicrobiaceae bacterium]
MYNSSLLPLNLLFIIGINEESQDGTVNPGRWLNNIGDVLLIDLGGGSEGQPELRGTGDLGLVIERASGSVLVVDTTEKETLG